MQKSYLLSLKIEFDTSKEVSPFHQQVRMMIAGEPLIASLMSQSTGEESDYCGKCGEGGELLICDGDCLQAFHLECVGLIKEPTSAKVESSPSSLISISGIVQIAKRDKLPSFGHPAETLKSLKTANLMKVKRKKPAGTFPTILKFLFLRESLPFQLSQNRISLFHLSCSKPSNIQMIEFPSYPSFLRRKIKPNEDRYYQYSLSF